MPWMFKSNGFNIVYINIDHQVNIFHLQCFHAYCQKSGQMNIDVTLDRVLQLYFAQLYQEKKSQLETEALRGYRWVESTAINY